MRSEILFASVSYDKYDPDVTLPAKFDRLIDKMGMEDAVKGKWTAIKMHIGRNIGYSTIHPLFVKKLVDKLKAYGAKPYITDQVVTDARIRGYTEDLLGVPIVPVCGIMDKYVYERKVDFKGLQNVDIGGNIHDAEAMIVLSHAKGHGTCGFGGACKNIAMGCVTDRTRHQTHGLEGGITWDETKCIHCGACITNCNHSANSFDKDDKYQVNYHHCTLCQHCVKVCPTGAITMDAHQYRDFQTGMAITTKEVLGGFKPGSVFYINFLTNITALCDCWGLTTPALVPDIGIHAGSDIVAIEQASVDAIKFENLIPQGVPEGHELGKSGHLFERLHGKDPYVQIAELEARGLGTKEYSIVEVK